MNKTMLKKNISIIIAFLAIFILAIVVWYSPNLFKGTNLTTSGATSLVKARNFALTNKYASENKLNVIMASDLVATQAHESFYGNKMAGIFYSYLFKINPNFSPSEIVFINCLILALGLLFFMLTVYYIWDLKIALCFALIYIFLPSNWSLAQSLIAYEWSILFFSLSILFFSLGTKKFVNDSETVKNIKLWPNGLFLFFSGICLGLACLCREAFFIVLPLLFIFLFFTKFKKQLFYIFTPVVIILAIFWLPNFIAGKNSYLLFFTNKTNSELKSSDFTYYAHLFPDPYVYHFEGENFVKEKYVIKGDTMTQLGKEKVLVNMGQASYTLWQKFKIATPLFFRHIFRFFSITEIGGPLIFFLMILGFLSLKKQNNYWFKFYIFWLIGSIFLFSYVNIVGRNHLMDFGWPIALTCSLGIISLAKLLSPEFKNKKTIVEILLLLLVIYNLILSSHVMWGQFNDNNSVPRVDSYVNKIKELKIGSTEIIASPMGVEDNYYLNYLTDKSIATFKPATMENLLKNNKLAEVLKTFEVKYIVGYSPELTAKIIKATSLKNIADSSLPMAEDYQGINNKNWLMNLIK